MIRQGIFFGSTRKQINLIVALVFGSLFVINGHATELTKANQQTLQLITTSSPQKRIKESDKYLNSLSQTQLFFLIEEIGAERLWRIVNRHKRLSENKIIDRKHHHNSSNGKKNVKVNLVEIREDIRQQLNNKHQKNAYIRVINNILLNSSVKQSKRGGK